KVKSKGFITHHADNLLCFKFGKQGLKAAINQIKAPDYAICTIRGFCFCVKYKTSDFVIEI
ncbi:MAG: hypothetical protein RR271_08420, partial [Oscillospiraceae bacterium]